MVGGWFIHNKVVLLPYYVCQPPQPPTYLGGRIFGLFCAFSTTHPTLFHQTFFVNIVNFVRIRSTKTDHFRPHSTVLTVFATRANRVAASCFLSLILAFSVPDQVHCRTLALRLSGSARRNDPLFAVWS